MSSLESRMTIASAQALSKRQHLQGGNVGRLETVNQVAGEQG